MGARKTSGADLPAMRPALTPEARENQMISLAMDLVEKRIREGTASSAETTHFLKLATSKTMLEKQKLEEENKLLRAKTEAINAAKDNEELYLEVLKSMKEYSGEDDGKGEEYECRGVPDALGRGSPGVVWRGVLVR